MNISVVPIVYLTIIYVRLLYFIRHQAFQWIEARKRRKAHRDLIVTRRILFTVIALTLSVLPNTGFGIMTNINLHISDSYYIYGIQFLVPVVAVLILSIVMIFITPQIKQILIKLKFCGNQVAPMTLPMRELRQPCVLLSTSLQV
ncbi:unnamed protein product [Rotaria sp. Silwood1]|nr:unnamed protein product [Rotaria sp. Silwood1]CAF1623875.1 unnamed protein product [Rotaria sp. Silwood1]CAF3349026.1 unnamed protein product [Rotaria sp. Silwood1]CAF3784304.1 unnamed protein product [Rotaria sp. Silwood1]CAF3881957.1 unnamed protein product [Rotaria sp. Silwood1]